MHMCIRNPFVNIIVSERVEMASPKRTLPGIPGIVQKDDARNLAHVL
jgi:hypothetical protein